MTENKTEKQVALITGASSGIGKAIALALARKGISIIVNYNKSMEKASETLDMIKKTSPESIMIKADVSKESEVKNMVDEIIKRFGRIDFLVNNAGITKDSLFKNMTLGLWEDVISTNLTGVFICTKECYKHITESKGRILNIASISGECGNIGHINYSASKAGIIGFTKSLAKEAAKDKVTVNAISPGMIDTPMLNTIPEKILSIIKESIPLKRAGNPEDVGELACFLLTNKGNYITGEVIRINGGLYM